MGADGITTNLGNFKLVKTDIPATTNPNFKFVLLYPKIFDAEADGSTGDPDFINYSLFFAQTRSDTIPHDRGYKVADLAHIASIAPINNFSLNPSPPRR